MKRNHEAPNNHFVKQVLRSMTYFCIIVSVVFLVLIIRGESGTVETEPVHAQQASILG